MSGAAHTAIDFEVGQRIDLLTILGPAARPIGAQGRWWRAQCACESEPITRSGSYLRSSGRKSCGCLARARRQRRDRIFEPARGASRVEVETLRALILSGQKEFDARDVMRLRDVTRVRAWTALTQLHRRRCLRRVARAKPGRGAQPARYRLTFRVWRALEAHPVGRGAQQQTRTTRPAVRTAASPSSLGG